MGVKQDIKNGRCTVCGKPVRWGHEYEVGGDTGKLVLVEGPTEGPVERHGWYRCAEWLHHRFLWDKEELCKECGGTGSKVYSNSAMWAGGIGGQTVTVGVCDTCWGSGDMANPWTNIRKMYNEIKSMKAIIQKLPRTADDVAVVPGMKIYPRYPISNIGRDDYCVARMVGVDPNGFHLGDDVPCDESNFSQNYSIPYKETVGGKK